MWANVSINVGHKNKNSDMICNRLKLSNLCLSSMNTLVDVTEVANRRRTSLHFSTDL